jgi:hypothetical protein
MENQPQELNIELTEEIADGQYANLAVITHSFAYCLMDKHCRYCRINTTA